MKIQGTTSTRKRANRRPAAARDRGIVTVTRSIPGSTPSLATTTETPATPSVVVVQPAGSDPYQGYFTVLFRMRFCSSRSSRFDLMGSALEAHAMIVTRWPVLIK